MRNDPCARRRQPLRQVAPQQPVDLGRSSLNPDETVQRSVCVIAKADPDQDGEMLGSGRLRPRRALRVQQEGTEVWVSVWGTANQPGKTGEIVVYDDKTLVGDRPHPEPGHADGQVQRV